MAEHDLRAVAFPTLDESQLAKLSRCTEAAVERYKAGQMLFQAGDRDFKLFVVKSGEIEIVDESGDAPKPVTIHRQGEFTGDVAQLTGGLAVVSAIARTDCEAWALSRDSVRQILNQCPDLGDIILSAFIARRQLLRESGSFTGFRVIGSRYSRDTFRIREFLARNRQEFTFLDLESQPDVDGLLRRFGVSESDTPVVIWGARFLLRNPSNAELAERIGIRQPLDQTVYDLAIVGAGMSGLAAAVYGASDGLLTVVLERTAPGGQAATSMRIENYLGFPTALSGSEFADRAVLQVHKFGANLSVPTPVVSLEFQNAYSVLKLEGGEAVAAKCLLIATGADYRKLDVEGCSRFDGNGVYYAATRNEGELCRGSDVAIVGGGNSAGQAAVFLAGEARRVYLIVRGDDLGKSMSRYLVRRIEKTPNIEILLDTEVQRVSGNGHVASIEILNNRTGETRTLAITALFSFIGAVPRTDWLPEEIERDSRQFICTGPALARSSRWTAVRNPFLLETSRPGVFASGDVRSGSVKRVASAVGEGAMAVQFVHEYLKEM
jgi:thioredoxin reductase (NADPH)